MKIKNPGSHTPTQFFFTLTAFWDKKKQDKLFAIGLYFSKKMWDTTIVNSVFTGLIP